MIIYFTVFVSKKTNIESQPPIPQVLMKNLRIIVCILSKFEAIFFKKKLARILHVTVCIFSKFERIFIVEKANIEIQPPQSPGS